MFFRRKPKANPDQDEPLVPHGLIWQAMQEQERQQAKAPSPPVAPSPDQPSRQTENKFNLPPSTRKLGAISPPIPWPSPMVQEIVRRPHSRIETERVAAITMGQVIPAQYREKPELSPSVVPKQETSAPRMVEPPRLRTLPTPVEKTRPASRHRFLGLRKRLRALGNSWAKAGVEVAASIRALPAELHVAERTRRAFEFLRSLVRTGLLWPRRLKPTLASVVTQSKTAHDKLLSIEQPIFKRVETWSERSAAATSKVLHYRIRVGVDSRGWSRVIARIKAMASGWTAIPLRLKFGSRLWTSMAMAAVSAGMTLALIVLVRHYGAEPVPARHSVVSPHAPVKPAKTTHLAPHAKVSEHPALKKPSAARPGAPANRTQSQENPAAALTSDKVPHRKARVRSNDDDDYVARDTTVYYGPSGKKEH